MKLLGIDPGSRNLGYCIVELEGVKYSVLEAGLLRFKQDSLREQLLELNKGLDLIFNQFEIDEVVIEDIFYAYNPKSVLKLAQFRGAIALKVLNTVGHYEEYTPLQVKKALTGNGKATKEQVAFMVKKLLNIKKEIKPYDITDAMAVTLTHAQVLIKKSVGK